MEFDAEAIDAQLADIRSKIISELATKMPAIVAAHGKVPAAILLPSITVNGIRIEMSSTLPSNQFCFNVNPRDGANYEFTEEF